MAKKATTPTAKPTWLGPNFSSAKERNKALRKLIADSLGVAVEAKRSGQPKPLGAAQSLVSALVGPLQGSAGPRAAPSAELAFVIAAFCVAEGRVLGLRPSSADVTGTKRLSGDRVTSEHLSRCLNSYNIPTTKGVLASSTFRQGYYADQAKENAQREFLQWMEDGRQLSDVEALFRALAREFAEAELAFPALPGLATDTFTFAATRTLVEQLLTKPSAGAFQQYLVAAFTAQEYALVHPAWNIHTKGVGTADASAKTAGDVQVRHGLRPIHAIEVSENQWESKIGQAGLTGQKTTTAQVTVIAPAVGLTGQAVADKALDENVPPGIDVAVVDLMSYLDAVLSRLTSGARAAAVRQLYGHLVTWGRTRPDLVEHLVQSLEAQGLTTDESAPETAPEVTESRDRLHAQSQLSDEPVVEVARDDLTTMLRLMDELLGIEDD